MSDAVNAAAHRLHDQLRAVEAERDALVAEVERLQKKIELKNDALDRYFAESRKLQIELETVKAAFSDALIALGEFDPETANRLSQRWFDVKGIT